MTKTDAMINRETTYYYDVNYEVETWPSWLDYPDHRNNRLMGYEAKEIPSQDLIERDCGGPVVRRHVFGSYV